MRLVAGTYPKIFGVGIRARIRSSSSTLWRRRPQRPAGSRLTRAAIQPVLGRPAGSAERLRVVKSAIYPKTFGVGIRARIRSSSSTVTRLMPFRRHESSTARVTIPRRTRESSSCARQPPRPTRSSSAIRRRTQSTAASRRSPEGAKADHSRQRAEALEEVTPRTSPGCGCRADLRPSSRRSSRRPGRGSLRSGHSSRTPRIARRARFGGECRRTRSEDVQRSARLELRRVPANTGR